MGRSGTASGFSKKATRTVERPPGSFLDVLYRSGGLEEGKIGGGGGGGNVCSRPAGEGSLKKAIASSGRAVCGRGCRQTNAKLLPPSYDDSDAFSLYRVRVSLSSYFRGFSGQIV